MAFSTPQQEGDMSDPTHSPEPSEKVGPDADQGPPSMPHWVKMLGLVVLVLILVFVIVQLATGGQHGPGLHRPSGAGQLTIPEAVQARFLFVFGSLGHFGVGLTG